MRPAPRHVYLHVPFCRSHCPYCDYPVCADSAPDIESWLRAVGEEFRLLGEGALRDAPLDTLLVGGGTPSTLGPGLAAGIRDILGEERLEGIGEWTVEVNPEDVTPGLLREWREVGVTRLSVGVQSLDRDTLEWLGRRHSPEVARQALDDIRGAGFPGWSVDLLYGLPVTSRDSSLRSAREMIELGVPGVSLFELHIESGAPGTEAMSAELADSDTRAAQYFELVELLRAGGYEWTEMTACALPGHQGLHMAAVLRGEPVLGLGPGAHTRARGQARWNLRDWHSYMVAAAEGRLPLAGEEVLDAGEVRLEALWSGLRLAEGVPRTMLTAEGRTLAERWAGLGLAHRDRERLRLTPEGWMRLDDLVLRLDATFRDGDAGVPLRGPKEV
jgi:coproporphyrinogen III oxidase-like Fe-S oxidoreductase